MVLTVQKSREDILKKLKGYRKVFLSGCQACAATCRTGGEPELKEMSEFLAEHGIETTGYTVPDRGCLLPKIKKQLREKQAELDAAEAILVLCCGLGNQVLTELTKKWVISGADTLFLGPEWKTELTPQGLVNHFEEKCSLCGECILDELGGLCPHEGKCEVKGDRPCGWLLIYNRLKELGRLDLMKVRQPLKDWSKKLKPLRSKAAAI
ncbi:MAG: hypothetical protein BWY73_00312 [candidate division TA06 bacterium ADurb.Bin417]|uniref:Methylene-tetrahydrofolate reductase C-terminal-like domain-containing protein n=1 Tax=candidate division TA06 bacterium ADurb.Bin417 TaxID=1852828 RepID=A0A1V5MKL0_UNCT6|nr:MAG: hypothetical protein BWY73_00312 [candidate division TA06 bacterium ADurb.Bin417]